METVSHQFTYTRLSQRQHSVAVKSSDPGAGLSVQMPTRGLTNHVILGISVSLWNSMFSSVKGNELLQDLLLWEFMCLE